MASGWICLLWLTLWLLVTLVGGAKDWTLPLRAAAMANAEMALDLNMFVQCVFCVCMVCALMVERGANSFVKFVPHQMTQC